MLGSSGAGWSSLAARRAHNPKVVGSNPTPATNFPLLDQRVSLVLNSDCSWYPGDSGSFAGLLIARLFRRRNQVRKLRFRVVRGDPTTLVP